MYTYQAQDNPQFPYKTNTGHIFETEARARIYCEMWNRHWEAMQRVEAVMPILTRAAYEEACVHFDVEVMSDAQCDSYGVRHGEFTPWLDGETISGYTPAYCVQMALARRRLGGILQARNEYAVAQKRQRIDAQPKPQPARQVVTEKLCDCGHYSAHPMNASRGTSCVNCYDEMSD